MIHHLLTSFIYYLTSWTTGVISTLGYPGIVLMMAIESACVPLPSEIIMPFSGFLVSIGRFSLWGVSLAGALGCLVGSLAAYALGYWGHEKVVRRFIRRWGKFILLSESDLNTAERQFVKHGSAITFVSRLLPAVRTVISLPAGIARMEIKRFVFYTFTGSFIWSLALAYVGMVLGENWDILGPYFHKFDIVIVGLGLVGLGFYIWHKRDAFRSSSA